MTKAFTEAVAALIDEHWDALKPGGADDDGLDPVDLAEMGDTYPSCWVLVIGASSIEHPTAPHMTVRETPRGQLPFTGIGLLEDAVHIWKGVE